MNINTADSITLQTIPGIGPSKAERIIDYRNTEGKFKKIEDIKKLPQKEKSVEIPAAKDNIIIENIVYSQKFSKDKQEIVNNLLDKYKNKPLTTEEMEDIMLKLYGIDFINKIYSI